jgi:hypothetical protein
VRRGDEWDDHDRFRERGRKYAPGPLPQDEAVAERVFDFD